MICYAMRSDEDTDLYMGMTMQNTMQAVKNEHIRGNEGGDDNGDKDSTVSSAHNLRSKGG